MRRIDARLAVLPRVVILGGLVGSGLIAAVAVDEVLVACAAPGGAVVLAGVYVALRGDRQRAPSVLTEPVEV